MRAPPPAAVDCLADLGWRAAQAVLHGLAAGALAAWTAQQLEFVHASWPAAVACGAAAGAWGWRRSDSPPFCLRWDGGQWVLRTLAAPEVRVPAPTVMMDLGPWMLLRCEPVGGPVQWLSVSRRSAGSAWLPFRAAVYSSAPVLISRSSSERPPF